MTIYMGFVTYNWDRLRSYVLGGGVVIRFKKTIAAELALVFIAVPLCIAVGSFIFYDRRYMLISIIVALTSCLVVFISFERGAVKTRKLVLIASMTALSVAGRFMFAPIPFFKPVTAVVIICGMELGCEAGFLCGSLSAFVSNFLFMQGPWTPFQMFIWGIIGFSAGLLSKPMKKSMTLLLIYGGISGVVYSAFMDIWTTVWWDGSFLLSRYIAAVSAAIPVTVVYIVSNIIFLKLLSKPVGEKLERIRIKYGI